MALNIQWTEEAESQLDDIIEYLAANWTEREINNFFNDLEKAIDIISKKPLQQKKSQRKKGTHEYQLSTQTTIFYDFDKTTAYILLLWPNKMNPENL
jgi:plasmid stabilization system protein ParE